MVGNSFGLHFIKIQDAEESYLEKVMVEAPNDDRCHCSCFADYLVENYVTGNSRFPPDLWAEAPSTLKTTNNAAESFHAHFNKQIATIFVFMDILQKLREQLT